ncbi:arginine/ornithine permease [Thermoflavimicrobium dichotomicum]|uniref:Arginine/ornithine permease n=2 Tax=Thermoflavimicrobium dichotomicum TaxID=46223 RepID=A0A1I3R045_9BACL|nr:amino acid permease [Thermoflavimicrobium dichotomicum]SFJ38891.1 arginine/ornithine permease [Thermoflavimicrobium dichotomicum]
MQEQQLKRTLKPRHLFMIALGGVVGTGFFLGTSQTLHQAGPGGALLAYTLGGLVMFLVMLCLGELAVAMPVSGSFQAYASKYIGPGTGFTVGIMYWFSWPPTIALDITSIAQMMKRWFPDTDSWVWIILFSSLLFIINAISARSFGESEFWFSSIKVITIILFIILGLGALFGLIPMKGHETAPMLTNYTAHGGFFPHGMIAILLTMITVNFSFQGTEMVGIAAGESDEPEKTIPRAIRQTSWRTILFYVLSIAILAGLMPWTEAGKVQSPFVWVFDQIGIPYAADIMNFVIITALFSAANAGLYSSTRIIWSLSKEGLVPKILSKVTKRGIPMISLSVTFFFSVIALLTNKYAPEKAFNWLINAAGMGAIIGWISIPLSLMFFRKRYLEEGGKLEALKFRTPLYPFVPMMALLLNVIFLFSLLLVDDLRVIFTGGSIILILCYVYYFLFLRKKQKPAID